MKTDSTLRRFLLLLAFVVAFGGVRAQWVAVDDGLGEGLAYVNNGQLSGATYFDSTTFTWWLDTTSAFVTTSQSLDLSGGAIYDATALKYFRHLHILNAAYCYHLENFPLLDSLTELDIHFAHELVGPIPIPSTLKTFNCQWAHLDTMYPLPSSLLYLSCGLNNFRTLPPLPNTLKYLECGQDTITLPSLPDSLEYLDCTWMHLTSLPTLPPHLETLNASYNDISILPSLPTSLKVLKVRRNNLQHLPDIPVGLTDLQCDENSSLSCIPYISQNILSSLLIGHTAIACVPNRLYASIYDVNPDTLPLCSPSSGCAYYNIVGNIHHYQAANCTSDSLQPGSSGHGIKVVLSSNGNTIQQTYTNSIGQYTFKTPSLSSYEVSIDTIHLPFTIACPSSNVRHINLTAQDSIRFYENFSLTCGSTDFAAASIYASRFRSQLLTPVHILSGNLSYVLYDTLCTSSNSVSGVITTTFQGGASFISAAAGALAPSTISSHSLTYNIPDLNSLRAGDLDIILQADTNATIGSEICITTKISPSAPDAIVADDSLTVCFPVLDSHDPNYKEVWPEALHDSNTDWLTYTIHFQNTGSDTAYLVVLRDTLSQYVDAASFQYLASSHHAVIQLDHNAMTFTFPHINLVDSATNPPLSEGWIQYRVKANAGLPNGTAINNTAYIYFDLNPAVVTNTATTTVQLVTCSDTTISISQAICAGDTFAFYGHALTAAGTYADTLTSAGGCDSIISLALTVAATHYWLYDTICQGGQFIYMNDTLTTSDSLTYNFQNILGCDSLVTVVLSVLPRQVVTFSPDSLLARGDLWGGSGGHLVWWNFANPHSFPLIGGSPPGGHYSGQYVQNDSFVFPGGSAHTINISYNVWTICGSSAHLTVDIWIGEGINDLSALSTIHLYPDPNTGTFTLQTEYSYGLGYRISDILGKEILQGTITADTQPVRLPDVADGVYTIAVDGARPLRFVVVR